jgi:hypothetical protein
MEIEYDYNNEYDKLTSLIPETDWMEVTDEEYLAIYKATLNNKSILFNKSIVEILDVKPMIPKLKDDLLKILEKENKEKEAQRLKQDEERKKKLEKQKAALEKKRVKIYEQLKAEFGDKE